MEKKASNKTTKSKFLQTDVIAVRPLCDLAGVSPFTIYRRQTGVYKTPISQIVRTKIVNALMRDIEPFLGDLGYDVKISPVKGNHSPRP